MAYGIPDIEVMGVKVTATNTRVTRTTLLKLWYAATHLQGLADAGDGYFPAPPGLEQVVAAINWSDETLCKPPWARHGGDVSRAPEFGED
jgi:hypothetical protein